jgi:hypothetical protein
MICPKDLIPALAALGVYPPAAGGSGGIQAYGNIYYKNNSSFDVDMNSSNTYVDIYDPVDNFTEYQAYGGMSSNIDSSTLEFVVPNDGIYIFKTHSSAACGNIASNQSGRWLFVGPSVNGANPSNQHGLYKRRWNAAPNITVVSSTWVDIYTVLSLSANDTVGLKSQTNVSAGGTPKARLTIWDLDMTLLQLPV